MVRFMIVLSQEEADGLAEIAAKELRDTRDQLRLILQDELARRGIIPSQNCENSSDPTTPLNEDE